MRHWLVIEAVSYQVDRNKELPSPGLLFIINIKGLIKIFLSIFYDF